MKSASPSQREWRGRPTERQGFRGRGRQIRVIQEGSVNKVEEQEESL